MTRSNSQSPKAKGARKRIMQATLKSMAETFLCEFVPQVHTSDEQSPSD